MILETIVSLLRENNARLERVERKVDALTMSDVQQTFMEHPGPFVFPKRRGKRDIDKLICNALEIRR